jgi:hypothetical protein
LAQPRPRAPAARRPVRRRPDSAADPLRVTPPSAAPTLPFHSGTRTASSGAVSPLRSAAT